MIIANINARHRHRLLILFLLSAALPTTPLTHHRHLLHQPFFFQTGLPPSPSPTASSKPPPQLRQQPKYPFSTTPPTAPQNPFFPNVASPPPQPPPTSLPTFPANISSLLLPHPPSSAASHSHILLISLSASLLAAAILLSITTLLVFLRRRNYRHASSPLDKTDSLRLFPPNTAPSDASLKPAVSSSTPPPPPPPHYVSTNRSSEFLYLGTLVSSQPGVTKENPVLPRSKAGKKIGLSPSPGSPELKPLPPLPRLSNFPSGEQFFKSGEVSVAHEEVKAKDAEEDNEEFFSPRGSSGRRDSPPARIESSSRREFFGENFGSRSFNSRTASYPYSHTCSPTSSIPDSSPPSRKTNSPDSVIAANFAARPRTSFSASSSSSTVSSLLDRGRASFSGQNKQSPPLRTVPVKIPPPPPPLPPAKFWEIPAVANMSRESISGPPPLVAPSRPIVVQSMEVRVNGQGKERDDLEKSEEIGKLKLKPLHWDKVRASSDKAMVWDQIKASSFQLNEEMIETLFMVNNPNMTQKDGNRRPVSAYPIQENQVLDPKKSQNVAILLRALNVNADEVCEALMEGNPDTLGAELLESLLKMAPTKEEERKLKDFKDESPFKLGPAEKFMKSMLEIPFAFKRVDAMLYMVNFDSEVEYLKRSFETLEAACGELRNSRMFLKLLEAVLKTGNRMNVGTNRGDAHAFKLDTLLKLIDVKGTDGKTTLLHFVVQEIIRAEGLSVSSGSQNQKAEKAQKQSNLQNDVEFRKLGLQVVSSLSGELTNVKKVATMDSVVISGDVAKLAAGISKITETIKLNEEIALKDRSRKFADSMNGFLKKAEEEILLIKGQENAILSKVKEITEYFHGNSTKEEAHPFRIFTVVRDFLHVLDNVCKEVGRINERSIYSSVRPLPVNPMTPPVFPGQSGRQQYSSSDDENWNRHHSL